VYQLSHGPALGQLQNAAFGAIRLCDVSAAAQQFTDDSHVISGDCAVQRPTHTHTHTHTHIYTPYYTTQEETGLLCEFQTDLTSQITKTFSNEQA